MLPYLQDSTRKGRDIEAFPDEAEEGEIVRRLYEDVNELYTDEHRLMA